MGNLYSCGFHAPIGIPQDNLNNSEPTGSFGLPGGGNLLGCACLFAVTLATPRPAAARRWPRRREGWSTRARTAKINHEWARVRGWLLADIEYTGNAAHTNPAGTNVCRDLPVGLVETSRRRPAAYRTNAFRRLPGLRCSLACRASHPCLTPSTLDTIVRGGTGLARTSRLVITAQGRSERAVGEG